jgi:26S proteasome regulatory subunit (ATPase 3-interacting protein)
VDVKIEGGEAEQMVYDYLYKQNRPYSALQVFDNLHEQVKKAQVPRVLENLVAQGAVVEKAFGKTKIYHVNQDNMPSGDPAAIKKAEYTNQTLARELAAAKHQVTQTRRDIAALEATPSNADAPAALEELRKRVEEKRAKLEMFKSSADAHKTADVDKLKYRFYKMLQEWKHRKRAAQENVAKTEKQFMAEQDIDSDASVKLDVKKYQTLCNDLGCAKTRFLFAKKKK